MNPDVLIIGAGAMGCLLAYRLSKRENQRVWVLEKALPGVESSGSAAGMLGAQMEAHTAGSFLEFCLYSRSLYKDLAQELFLETGISIGYRESGLLELALTDSDSERLIGRYEWQKAQNLPIEMLDTQEVLSLEPQITSSVKGALFYPNDHQVNPRTLMQALFQAAQGSGATFLTGKRLEGLVIERGKIRGVLLEKELLSASQVILATGAWTSAIAGLPPLRTSVRPIRGQMLVLGSTPEALSRNIMTSHGYLVPRLEGSILVGSTMESVGFQKGVTAEALLQLLSTALHVLPILKESPLVESWSGFRPSSEDGYPLIGLTSVEGLWVISGHHRNGILLLPGSVELLMAQWKGQKTPVDDQLYCP
jgi:glycine oxidase